MSMRLIGASQPSLLQRVLPWIVAIGVFTALTLTVLWGRQQESQRRIEEARADAAEAELVSAQASLTTLRTAVAVASASAVAKANDPTQALKRALDLVLAAYQDPSEPKIRALTSAGFSDSARSVFQTELEHLVSGAKHLGSKSGYTFEVTATEPNGTEEVRVRTHEQWTYDERDQADRPSRCVREDSDQTYTMRRTATDWIVQNVDLGASRRSDC